ncbi:MAG: phosphatase PAP2 family protein, partial [Candidatus Cloacimonadaceae bacterium]|nr:phosphatase PAP2 family protein [Candidatus Cloacimonadaceae bacterium]
RRNRGGRNRNPGNGRQTRRIITAMISINDRDGTADTSRPFLLSADFLLFLAILISATLLFALSDLDLRLQDRLYGGGGEWTYARLPMFQFLYRFGNLPALFAALGGVLVFALGYRKPGWLKYRKVVAYLALCLILGPGLIVNALLKDNWGRPRPRDLLQYEGKFAYEAPLTIDTTSPGKSFPCGHATVGYYFFAFYFLLKGRQRWQARLFFLFALSYGTLIGFVRMAQGGHFASDVIWAGGLIYLVSYILFRALKMHQGVFYEPKRETARKTLRLHQKIALLLLALLIATGVSLATPYSRHRNLDLTEKLSGDTPVRIVMNISIGDLKISQSDRFALYYENSGFGLPGSKLSFPQEFTSVDSIATLSISQRKRGFFTELGSKAELVLDSTRVTHLDISLKGGDLLAQLDRSIVPKSFSLSNTSGGITLKLPRVFEDELIMQSGSGEIDIAPGIRFKSLRETDDRAIYRINSANGKISVNQ